MIALRADLNIVVAAQPAERVVAFYNKGGTCEQRIKEGKGAIKWTRLSCRKVAIPRQMFQEILRLIAELWPEQPTGGVRPNVRENRPIRPRPPCGLPEVLVAVRTSRLLALQEARKSR